MQRVVLLIAYLVVVSLYSFYHPEDFVAYHEVKGGILFIIFLIILYGGSFQEEKFNQINRELDQVKSRLSDFQYIEKKRAEASFGDIRSQMILADLLLQNKINSDDDVKNQNLKEAVRWHQKAARQGNARAQYYLGKHYDQGIGVKKNINRAYTWFVIAEGNIKSYVDDTNELAREKRLALENELNPEQQSELIHLATEWQAAFVKRQEEK